MAAGGEVSMCTPAFARRVVQSRWFVVFASMVVMAASGSTYIFALYSKVLRSKLGYNQETLNKLSFFKDLGTNVGIISGLVQQVAPTWAVLLIGAAMNLAGYLMIYLALTGRTAEPPVWLMCFYICFGANALTFSNTGALVACVKNFPESRGIVIGLLKSFVGLSGAIYTQLYLAIYGDDAASLVLLVAWLPAAFDILTVYTIRVLPDTRRRDGEGAYNTPFYHFLYLSLVLAAYLLVMIVVQKQVHFSHAAYVVTSTALLIILLAPSASSSGRSTRPSPSSRSRCSSRRPSPSKNQRRPPMPRRRTSHRRPCAAAAAWAAASPTCSSRRRSGRTTPSCRRWSAWRCWCCSSSPCSASAAR